MAQNPRRVASTIVTALAAGLVWTPIANAGQTQTSAHLAHDDTHLLLSQQHNTQLGQDEENIQDLRQRVDEFQATIPSSISTSECVNHDAGNPVYQQWPDNISGNLNGTTMIVPITMEAARKAIPSQYGILERAWRAWLPDFPEGMYPMMAVAVHDHDLRFPLYNVTPPDFSRVSLEFPFVDALNDGYSSFRWAQYMLISSNTPAAIAGSEAFGVSVHPASFDPPCNAYKADPEHPETTVLRAWSDLPIGNTGTTGSSSSAASSAPAAKCSAGRGEHGEGGDEGKPWLKSAFSLSFTTTPLAESNKPPYPLNFLVNITNQPVFADPKICDNYKRLFNTTLTTDPAYAPVAVEGTVMGKLEPFAGSVGEEREGKLNIWEGVFGWRLATAFLEPPVPGDCEVFKGYEGTGPGDSAQP